MRSFPAVRTNSTFQAVNMTNPRPGIWVLDFGRSTNGFTALVNVTGSAGDNVTIQHGEIMDHYTPNSSDLVYFGNYGAAQGIDIYYLSGKGLESHTPFFTYHGYRFVQVQNWPNGSVPRIENFLAIEMFSAVEKVGSFKTNTDIFNRIHNMIVYSQANNLMSYPTPCNNRDDRLGWMADTWLTAEEASYNFEMSEFYRHYLNLIGDDQFYDGRLSDTAPIFGYQGGGDPTWGAGYSFLLDLFNAKNDTDTVQRHFQGVKDFADFVLRAYNQTGLAKLYGAYGDWVPPNPVVPVSTSMVSSYSLIKMMKDVATFAQVLGYEKVRAEYSELYKKLFNEYNQVWYNSTNQSYGVQQTADVLAIDLGVAPNGTDLSLLQKISNSTNHFDSGILGMNLLFPILSQINRTDVALSIASQTSYPSYGYLWMNDIETPATTLWEVWDAPSTLNDSNNHISRDHVMFASIDAWFYKTLAGIDLDQATVSIPNTFYTPLRKVEANTRSHLGEVAVKWERVGGVVCVEETQPNDLMLDCGVGAIESIEFVSVGQPQGTCATYTANPNCTKAIDLSSCLGKVQCSLSNWWDGACKMQLKIAQESQSVLNALYLIQLRLQLRLQVAAWFRFLFHHFLEHVCSDHSSAALWHYTVVSLNTRAKVPKGTHQFVLSGERTMRQVSTESSMTIAMKCPTGMRIVSISNVQSPCHPQVLLHHVETSCIRSQRCKVDLKPVFPYITSKCVEKATVQYECGF